MSSDNYKTRRDLVHDLTVQIDDLLKDRSVLQVQLKSANEEIGRLAIEVVQLKDGQIELRLKLQDANNEIGRLGMVVRREIAADETLRREFGDNSF